MIDIAKQHVFLVDDEPGVLKMVGRTLERFGLKVSCFGCGSDCLKELRSETCDLLITDVKMPEMDGIELLKKVKHLAPWIPVLMITGYGDIQTSVKAIKAGALDFIEKPLVKKDFVRKVKSILKKSASNDTYLGKHLTRTEKKILKLVIDGKRNREIAHLLECSVRTVEEHRAHLKRKLGVNKFLDLFKRAMDMGLVDLSTEQRPDDTTQDSEIRLKDIEYHP